MENPPLIVDLDGTILKTDTLFEGLAKLIKQNFLFVFLLPFWLCQGKLKFKNKISKYALPNFQLLPLNSEFVSFVRDEKAKNRTVILATASTERYAKAFAEELGIFDDVLSSSETVNLKSKAKLSAILSKYEEFDYAGDSSADEPLFKLARRSHLVNATPRLINKYGAQESITVWGERKETLKDWVSQLRIYQWVKNFLLFVPVFVSHQYIDASSIVTTFLGFISIGLLASSTYVLNDILDLDSDRLHARKKSRPFASGKISIKNGVVCGGILFVASLILAASISTNYLLILLCYLVTTLAYSLYLKSYALIDTIILAGLYTIRIVAGTILIEVDLSFWLLAFSMFTFYSLALVKRCSEISSLRDEGKLSASGRDYHIGDYNLLQSFGVGSALLALLTLMFYIENSFQADFYNEPQLLWFILPAFAYFFMRIWLKTSRSEMHDDPIVFALKDKGSLITVAFIVSVTVIARLIQR